MNQPSPSCERESVDTVGELIVAVADYDPDFLDTEDGGDRGRRRHFS